MSQFLPNWKIAKSQNWQQFSSVKELISGVPQSSVLDPVLFIIFINSITDSLPCNIKSKIFADDLKTYARITDETGINEFKSALAELSTWAECWQLPISCGKSNWMFISNRNWIRVMFLN